MIKFLILIIFNTTLIHAENTGLNCQTFVLLSNSSEISGVYSKLDNWTVFDDAGNLRNVMKERPVTPHEDTVIGRQCSTFIQNDTKTNQTQGPVLKKQNKFLFIPHWRLKNILYLYSDTGIKTISPFQVNYKDWKEATVKDKIFCPEDGNLFIKEKNISYIAGRSDLEDEKTKDFYEGNGSSVSTPNQQELHNIFMPKLSMVKTNANDSTLISLQVIEGDPLTISCLQDLELIELITCYQWQRHSGNKDESLGSQYVTLKENTNVLHIKKTNMENECILQCKAKTRLGQLIIKHFAVYITPNSKNIDHDYEELKKENSNFIKTFDLRTWQGWLAFIVCVWISLNLGCRFFRFLLHFVTRLHQMRRNNSATICSIIFGLLKDFHANFNPFVVGGQSYQSDFRKLEDRDREQIKELKDLLSVFHRKFALFEIRLEFLERTQRRPAAVNGHFSNSVGRSIHLQTQMGDDTNTSQT